MTFVSIYVREKYRIPSLPKDQIGILPSPTCILQLQTKFPSTNVSRYTVPINVIRSAFGGLCSWHYVYMWRNNGAHTIVSSIQPGLFKTVKATAWYLAEHDVSQVCMSLTEYKETPLHEVFQACCDEAKVSCWN